MTRFSTREINNLKARMSTIFKTKDLSAAKQILGMKISRDRPVDTLNLSQEQLKKYCLSLDE